MVFPRERKNHLYTKTPTFKNMTWTCKERECKQQKNNLRVATEKKNALACS
jgi:hypothetical protein